MESGHIDDLTEEDIERIDVSVDDVAILGQN